MGYYGRTLTLTTDELVPQLLIVEGESQCGLEDLLSFDLYEHISLRAIKTIS